MADTKVGIILEAQDRATRQIKDVSASLDTMRNRFEKQIDASKQFATGIAAAGVALGGFIGYGVKVAADLQTAKIGLTTLLGSAEEAGKTVERIKKESARTPFELVGLTQATQLLASVTKNGDKAIDIIMNVGEGLAAMGKGQAELDRIIVNLQQVAAVGKASMTDIKQFAFAGIPIFEMLTEQTKLTGEGLSKFIEGGGVSFEMLTTMFDKANDAGGRFFNAYNDQAGSFNQSLSNLKDSFGIFLATTVQSTGIFDLLTEALKRATAFLDEHKDAIANAIKWLGEHKIVIYLVAGAIVGALVPAIYAAALAFGTLFISLLPFMLAGAAIAGIIYGIIWIVKNWDMLKAKAAEIWEGIKEKISSIVEGIRNKIQEVWGAITGKTSEIWNGIKDAISGAISTVENVIGGILGKINEVWQAVWNGIKEFSFNVVGFIVGAILELLDFFFPNWQEKLRHIADIAVEAFNFLKDKIFEIWQFIIDYITEKIDEFTEKVSSGMEKVSSVITSVYDGIRDTTLQAWGAVVGHVTSAMNQIWGFLKPILIAIKEFWAGVWNEIADLFSAAFNKVKDTATSVVDWIAGKIDDLVKKISALTQPIADLAGKAQSAFGSLSSSVSTGVQNITNRGKSAIGLAEGGIVTRPTFAMIGEGGEPEAVIPLSKLGAVGGGGITINIMGGNYLSESAGAMLGNQIIDALRRNIRL